MCQAWGQGGHTPPQILADQKAPPGSGGALHYYSPPRFLDFDTCLNKILKLVIFLLGLFLEARAEIPEKISLVFWKIRRHQKDILKLTDLYSSQSTYNTWGIDLLMILT